MPDTERQYLPLSAATFHVLLALRNGARHGYAIMRDVEQLSEGVVRLGPGTLYSAIKRLLADGLIVESEDRPDSRQDDERRRYYQLTDLGDRVYVAEVARLKNLITRATQRRRGPKLREA